MSVTVYFPCTNVRQLQPQGTSRGDVRLRSFCLQILQLVQQQHTRDVTQTPIKETAGKPALSAGAFDNGQSSADKKHLSWTCAPGDTDERASGQHYSSGRWAIVLAKVFDKMKSIKQHTR